MYESLLRYSKKEFILAIIAMDDLCAEVLNKLALKNILVISLSDFEDDELLSIKTSRTRAEYCWSSTAKSIIYVLNKYEARDCTYIDADIMFFNDPEIILNNIPDSKSIMITEHRYTAEYDQTLTSGKYCVQFMYFKNDFWGLKALYWWKDRCIEWCGEKTTDGKMGDQMYLDDWCERFERVYEMESLGGGIAPWNVQQYTFFQNNSNIRFKHIPTKEEGDVIFYHFHAMELFDKNVVRLCPAYYSLPDTAISYIYKNYIRLLDEVIKKYKLDNTITYNNSSIFESNIDELCHEKHFFNYSLFI